MQVASLTLWSDLRPDEVTPAQVHARLCLPGLSLPLLHRQDVLEACRTAAQLSAMSSVLVGLLLGQGSLQVRCRAAPAPSLSFGKGASDVEQIRVFAGVQANRGAAADGGDSDTPAAGLADGTPALRRVSE